MRGPRGLTALRGALPVGPGASFPPKISSMVCVPNRTLKVVLQILYVRIARYVRKRGATVYESGHAVAKKLPRR